MPYLYTVKHKKIEQSVKDKITIFLFGDIHRDTTSCDAERWKWFLKQAKEYLIENPNTYFIGMGDYLDFASTKEQKKLANGELHETTMEKLDRVVEKDCRELAGEMSFMQGHLLGLLDGNHSWKYQSGKLLVEDLAERLQTVYLGWLSHFTLLVQLTDHRQAGNVAIHFALCHGKAGGKTHGITINQVADIKQVFPVADVYCMGHDHQRGAWPTSILVPSYRPSKADTDEYVTLKQKRQFLCRSGSFKRAYVDNTIGYEIGRVLRPADLGALRLDISFHRDRKDGDDILITDITAIT